MKNYETAKQIRNILLKKQAECYQYDWSADFIKRNMKESTDKIKSYEWFTPIQPNDFTLQELEDLGFGRWNDEGLMLIPLWLLPFLTEEFEGACISDCEIQTLKTCNLDADNRFGCIAYGVYPNDKGE
jgi:hypothetical protein